MVKYGPAVNQRTHESMMMHQVDHFTVKRAERWPLGFYDELQRAIDACALSLGMPNFLTPITAADGYIIPPTEQKARWIAGLDPRTGRLPIERAQTSRLSAVERGVVPPQSTL